jgi:CubicO group peptidase (beta-lactamase class C family)
MKIYTNPSISEPIIFNGGITDSNTGISTDGIEYVSEVFDRQLQEGLHPGAQLVVLRHGRVVVDRCGGHIDTRKNKPVTPETRYLTFSITKPLTSSCIFKLIGNNAIALDAQVGDYWPEFSNNGKEDITIRHVLLHQSGLPKRGFLNQIINISNWEKITHDLSRQKPDFPPGSKTAYQYLNFGFILGEVIRRVTGLQADEYLDREFLLPMKLCNTCMRASNYSSDSYARLFSATWDHRLVAGVFNGTSTRQALFPAASLHSTARDLAVFFQMLLNGGVYAGHRYMKPATVQLATSLGYEGFDASLRQKTRWGYGFSLGGEHVLHPEIPDGMGWGSSLETFGHFGQRTSMAWADKRTGLVVVFLCNRFLASLDHKIRLQEISDAVWDAIEV